MRAGPALDVHADGRRLDIERRSGNNDRHGRRIKRDGTVGPARPQHVGDIGGAEQDDGAKHRQWRQQRAVPGAWLAPRGASSSGRTILCEGSQTSAPGAQIGRIMPRQVQSAWLHESARDGGIYHLLRIGWRSPCAFAKHACLFCVEAADDPGIVADAVRAAARLCRRGHVQLGLPGFHQPLAELRPAEHRPRRCGIRVSPAARRVGAVSDHAQHHPRPTP